MKKKLRIFFLRKIQSFFCYILSEKKASFVEENVFCKDF